MLSKMTFAAVVLAVGQVPRPQFNPDRAVVFSAGDATRQLAQCSREVPGAVGGTWTPDQETIRRFEALLAPALQEAINHEQPDESKRPAASGYYRQYFGLVVDGHRIVYVNGFHEVYLNLSSEGRLSGGCELARENGERLRRLHTVLRGRIRSGVGTGPTPSLQRTSLT